MTNYKITEIKAVAVCAGDSTIQDALLIHEINDIFGDGDCILFGYSIDDLTTDIDVCIAITNETPISDYTVDENGVYFAE